MIEKGNYFNKQKKQQSKVIQDNEQKFEKLIADLNQDNFWESLDLLCISSQDENCAYQIIVHTQFIIERLEQTEDRQRINKLLKILINLSHFNEFEMVQDTQTVEMFLKIMLQFPRQVVEFFTNYINVQRSCPNMIYHILESGIISKFQNDIQINTNQEQNKLITRFVCALGKSRPSLDITVLKSFHSLLLQIFKSTPDSQIVFQIQNYLSDYSELKQNILMAKQLYQTFHPILKSKLLDIDEIQFFLFYLTRHSQLLEQLSKDQTIVSILQKLIYSGSSLRVTYQIFLSLLQKTFGFMLIQNKLFEYILQSFDKNQYSQQYLLIQIIGKYLIDSLQQDPKTPINKLTQNCLDYCLKSEHPELVQKVLDILQQLSQVMKGQNIVISYLKPTLQYISDKMKSQQMSNRIFHVLNKMEEQK